MGVVQIIGGADRYVIYKSGFSLQFVDMPVKPLKFSKKMGVRKVAVDDTNGVIRVERGNQIILRFFDGFHMSRCDITCRTDEGKVFHSIFPILLWIIDQSSADNMTPSNQPDSPKNGAALRIFFSVHYL